jgi:uncharacterized protein (TIGR02284 family)
MAAEDREEPDLNRDPLTDEPGAHPVGTGVGAAGGAMAGAAAGTIGGPLGTLVGGVIGAVVGGLAGKAAAEAVNPSTEEAHWRENYSSEPYFEQGRSFEDYQPAYLHGVQGRLQHDTDWDEAEPRLASEWSNARAGSGLDWEQARPASRAAWDRVDALRSGGSGAMGSDTAMVRANDLAGSTGASGMAFSGGTDMAGSSIGMDQDVGGHSSASGMGTTGMESGSAMGSGIGGSSTERGSDQNTGSAGMVGAMQSAGNDSGDRDDVIDALQDLVECCKDGEYGFRTSAEQAKRQDLKTTFQQRADDCRRGADELNERIRSLGGKTEDSGSALGAMHRGWVSVKSTLSTYDDKAILEECERGEDNAMARYRKALKQDLPAELRQLVERQMQGVQRNHDQIKMLRDQVRASADSAGAGTSGGTMSQGGAAGQGMDMTQGMNSTTRMEQDSGGQRMGGMGSGSATGADMNTGTAGLVGGMQSAGNTGGDRDDVIDALQDLVECCKDGEYGFRTSAEQASSAELKSLFTQRADDCRRGADELNQQIRSLGGKAEDSGSVMGAMHRGWVSVKSSMSTQDDKAVLEECERGEDNAVARYRKAMKQQLPEQVRQIVERQAQAVQRNHDEIKRLRDQFRQ